MKLNELWYQKIKKDFLDNKDIITIPDFIDIEDLFNKLQTDKTLNLTNEKLLSKTYHYKIIKGNYLTNDQRKKIEEAHLEFYIINKYAKIQISDKILFRKYPKSSLENKKYITIYSPLNNYDIENFKYINEKTLVSISDQNEETNELTYFNNIKKIITNLANHEKTYQIAINVVNRKLLEDSKLLQNIPNNIKIYISHNLESYTLEEYLQEEKILKLLVDPIKNSNLSPLEKYISVYNIVKQFKKYKDNEEAPAQARNLKEIINNDYIVCVGFSKLLQVMLQYINIPCDIIYLKIDNPDEPQNDSGHARNLIKLDDDKYNIHGIYLSDATWDNNLKNDLYLNILLTHDEKKEAKDNEYLETEDMLFDFHNFEEYNIKINTLLYKTAKKFKTKKEQEKYANAYIKIYKQIQEHLKFLDHEKYIYFHNKYKEKIYNIDNLKKQEQIAYSFFTEYGLYIIPLSNNKIKKETIINAAIVTKREIECMDQNEIKEWQKENIKLNKNYFEQAFPYIYNYQTQHITYLESKKKIKDKL